MRGMAGFAAYDKQDRPRTGRHPSETAPSSRLTLRGHEPKLSSNFAVTTVMRNPMTEPESPFSIRTTLALLLVTALAGLVVGGYFVASYQGTDENGYLLTAKRLATTGDIAKRTDDPNEFISGNWVEARDGEYYAKYPIGYPLLCAIAYKLGGPSAVFLINPILAVMAVVGMFFLARAMLGDFAGALAAIFLATNPMHAFYGISALSHSGSICFATWGMYFVWRWSERGGGSNAILGAAFTAYATSVRYTEALLVLPAVAMVIWRCVEMCRSRSPNREEEQRLPFGERLLQSFRRGVRSLPWGQLAAMALVSLIVLTPLLIQHWVAYGSPFVSGYSLCGESTGFGWKWFEKNWRLMLSRLDSPGLFLLFPLGVAGLCCLAAVRAKLAVFLSLWIVPGLLLYTAYYWAPAGEGPWYIRFFVSLFPPFLVSALALLFVAGRPGPTWNVAVGCFALLVAGVNLRETQGQLDRKADQLRFTKSLTEAVRATLPEGSVILSDEHVLNYLEFAGDYRLYSQGAYERNALVRKTKVLNDDEPHPFHREKARDLMKWLGKKTDAQLNELLRQKLSAQLAEGHAIAIVTSQGQLARWRGRLSDGFQFRTVAEPVEVRQNPKGEPQTNSWILCMVEPIDRDVLAAARESKQLEAKLDQLRFRIETMRSEYNQQFPGAREMWSRINDLEKQSRDMNEELKKARARERAVAHGTPKRNPAVQ